MDRPLKPMRDFDPSKPAMVHDALNDKLFEWRPEEYAGHFAEHAIVDRDGIIGWDGLLLAGWCELP